MFPVSGFTTLAANIFLAGFPGTTAVEGTGCDWGGRAIDTGKEGTPDFDEDLVDLLCLLEEADCSSSSSGAGLLLKTHVSFTISCGTLNSP